MTRLFALAARKSARRRFCFERAGKARPLRHRAPDDVEVGPYPSTIERGEQSGYVVHQRDGARAGSRWKFEVVVVEVCANKDTVLFDRQLSDVVEKLSPVIGLKQVKLDIR